MAKIKASSDFELAKFHLDRFWHEIFWRRENEQKITVWTVGLYGAVLALVYGRTTDLDINQKIILSCFPLILGLVASWYLQKNWAKSKEIARIIVRLNKSIGSWEKGLLVDDILYPDPWEKWGTKDFTKDKISLFYFLFVIGATILTIIGIFLI